MIMVLREIRQRCQHFWFKLQCFFSDISYKAADTPNANKIHPAENNVTKKHTRASVTDFTFMEGKEILLFPPFLLSFSGFFSPLLAVSNVGTSAKG